jgi:CHAD domain-containing protein
MTGYSLAQIALRNFQIQLHLMQMNIPGCISGRDPLPLHDFRVANRRTRTALKAFQPLLPDDIFSRFKNDFKWIQKKTNRVRDLDVYLAQFPDYKKRVQKNFRKYLTPLQEYIENQRSSAQDELVEVFQTERFQKIFSDWADFLKSGMLNEPPAALEDAHEYGCRKIIKHYQKLRKSGQKLTMQTPAKKFHSFRIEIKKLRYIMEFFNTEDHALYNELRRALKTAQDAFGAYQDADVQVMELREFTEALYTQGVSLDTLLVIGQLLGSLSKKQKKRKKNCLKQTRWLASDLTARQFQQCFQYPVDS